MRRLLALMLMLMAAEVAACAAPRATRPEPRPVGTVAAPPRPAPPESPPEPALDPAEARASAEKLVAEAKLGPYVNDAETLRRAREIGLDETRTRRLAEAMVKDCLDAQTPGAKACAAFDILAPSVPDATLETLLVYLGEIGETKGYTPSMRFLVRLHARGSTRAGMEVERLLMRRMTSWIETTATCSPPTGAEIAASTAALGDFAVVEAALAATPTPKSKAVSVLVARKPTPAELSDLAYFYAATVAGSGASVASSEEDKQGTRLVSSSPDLAVRDGLAKELRGALFAGNLEAHSALARQYLESLGYPGKIRDAEEADRRWGGPAYSYVMRDLARSAELLGKRDDAEALYRRATPGGGACGTSAASVRTDQIQGVIRTSEQTRGCRAVVAERLFSVSTDQEIYGTARLTAAGFDVARLYRGALLTLGRRDVTGLEQLFRADARLGPAALARLQVRGQEAWADQVRAIAGYAAEAKARAIPQLVALARRGLAIDRVAALDALGSLLEDRGQDPCLAFGAWGSHRSGGQRKVSALSHACATELPSPEVDKLVKTLSGFATDPNPEVREAVAVALGQTGMPSARSSLALLATDPHAVAGSVCHKNPDGTDRCTPNRPVRQAAEDGLVRIREADARRAEERARARQSKPSP